MSETACPFCGKTPKKGRKDTLFCSKSHKAMAWQVRKLSESFVGRGFFVTEHNKPLPLIVVRGLFWSKKETKGGILTVGEWVVKQKKSVKAKFVFFVGKKPNELELKVKFVKQLKMEI